MKRVEDPAEYEDLNNDSTDDATKDNSWIRCGLVFWPSSECLLPNRIESLRSKPDSGCGKCDEDADNDGPPIYT